MGGLGIEGEEAVLEAKRPATDTKAGSIWMDLDSWRPITEWSHLFLMKDSVTIDFLRSSQKFNKNAIMGNLWDENEHTSNAVICHFENHPKTGKNVFLEKDLLEAFIRQRKLLIYDLEKIYNGIG